MLASQARHHSQHTTVVLPGSPAEATIGEPAYPLCIALRPINTAASNRRLARRIPASLYRRPAVTAYQCQRPVCLTAPISLVNADRCSARILRSLITRSKVSARPRPRRGSSADESPDRVTARITAGQRSSNSSCSKSLLALAIAVGSACLRMRPRPSAYQGVMRCRPGHVQTWVFCSGVRG
jgi:hypothetical protein